MNNPITVKQLNYYLKTILKNDYVLRKITIRGEVSNIKKSRNNLYFSLKEDMEIVDCVIYDYDNALMEIVDSDSIVLEGSLIYYSYMSKLIIKVDDYIKDGISNAYLKLLKLKEKYSKLGYFDKSNKKALPFICKRVGLITSNFGAAKEDFINIFRQAEINATIYFAPVKVQGIDSATSIAQALDRLEELNLDCIVITRGGGSEEDLSTFNNEDIIKKVFTLKTPVISAIGHKIDTTLIDLVADLCAQTPTHAANLIVSQFLIANEKITSLMKDIEGVVNKNLEKYYSQLNSLQYRLKVLKPENVLHNKINEIDYLHLKISDVIDRKIIAVSHQLELLYQNISRVKDNISKYKEIIRITDLDNNVIKTAESARFSRTLCIHFIDGNIQVEVLKENE